MFIRCPQCTAIIHFEEAPSSVLACWMCNSLLDRGSFASGPPTVNSSSPSSRSRTSPIGLSDTSFPEAANPALPADERLKLFVVIGPSRGSEFELAKSITTIGRMGGGADVEIDDPEVSRSHCAIEVRRDGVLLYDLGSLNGTYVGGARVSVIRLDSTSIFQIGLSKLRLNTRAAMAAPQLSRPLRD
jgi:hypothetical protein